MTPTQTHGKMRVRLPTLPPPPLSAFSASAPRSACLALQRLPSPSVNVPSPCPTLRPPEFDWSQWLEHVPELSPTFGPCSVGKQEKTGRVVSYPGLRWWLERIAQPANLLPSGVRACASPSTPVPSLRLMKLLRPPSSVGALPLPRLHLERQSNVQWELD